jgi:hypothetical protein
MERDALVELSREQLVELVLTLATGGFRSQLGADNTLPERRAPGRLGWPGTRQP